MGSSITVGAGHSLSAWYNGGCLDVKGDKSFWCQQLADEDHFGIDLQTSARLSGPQTLDMLCSI